MAKEEHCDFERKWEEQYNKKTLALVAGAASILLLLGGAILGVYISITTDIVSVKKDISQLRDNQITQKELAAAITEGVKPLADQIARIADKNNEQDKEIFRLGLTK
jgi:type VI protein secretion system component VasK